MIAFNFSIIHATAVLLTSPISDGPVKMEQISIEATHEGMFTAGTAWSIQIDGNGNAHLSLHGTKTSERDIKISPERLSEFKECLDQEKYFDLPEQVGLVVPSGGKRRLVIRLRGKEHSVTINYLNLKELKDVEIPTARRAARIWASLRGLFDDRDAFDIRPYEESVRK